MGDCSYLYGNKLAEKRVRFLKQLLGFYGLDQSRLRANWVSSAEAQELTAEIREFIDELRGLGPSPLRQEKPAEQAA